MRAVCPVQVIWIRQNRSLQRHRPARESRLDRNCLLECIAI
ncbi:MAG: hypothetical protein RL318_2866 [Fibrobacterota bacterium]|jgi:hypothetical protein